MKPIMLNYNPYAKKKRPHPDSSAQQPVTQNVMKTKPPPAVYPSTSTSSSSSKSCINNGNSTGTATYQPKENTGNVLGNKSTISILEESSPKRFLPQTMKINPNHQVAKNPYSQSKTIDLTMSSSDEEQESLPKSFKNPYQKPNLGYSPSLNHQQQKIPSRTINPYKKSSPAIQSSVGITNSTNSHRKAPATPLGSNSNVAKRLCQVHAASPSSITTKKPAIKPPPITNQTSMQPTKPQYHNKLQSIRPSTWNDNTNQSKLISSTTPTAAATTTTSISTINTMKTALSTQVPSSQTTKKPTIELPGETPLPREIAYSSDDVKAVNDEYRKDLVMNANLSKPLLNGWTLYPHQ